MSENSETAPGFVTSYKGFNLDWTCQGFKYEIGQTYKHTGEVNRCLVCRNDEGEILAIRATKVGENGVEPDVFYRLNAGGEFILAEESE